MSKSRVSERSGILLRRGIIFGVSDELTEYRVATEIEAQAARRMVKRNSSGSIVKTKWMDEMDKITIHVNMEGFHLPKTSVLRSLNHVHSCSL